MIPLNSVSEILTQVIVLTLATAAVLIAWFCRFEDGRADA